MRWTTSVGNTPTSLTDESITHHGHITRGRAANDRPAPPLRGETAPLLARLGLVVILIAAVGFAVWPLYARPDAVAASAAADRFSAERAMAAVHAIADAPHPIASPEHAAVVDYLVGELRDLGLSPQVQDDTGVLYDTDLDPSQVSAAHLQNVIARLPGTAGTGTVMLYGHYGSVPMSNNAADGAAGVAAVLETIRAIRASGPLRNDLLIVFADGDETPALGPHLFRRHPEAKEVTVGIALESLSNRGAVALAYAGQGMPNAPASYTSAANGSWLYSALSVMPHQFTALALNDMQIASPELSIATKDAGAGGVGSLLLGGGEAYHTLLDSPANLDVASLQAYGDNALALARYFGNTTLDPKPTAPELVAFTVVPNTVISYSRGLALALAVVLVGLFIAVVVVGLRRHLLTGWGLVLGFGVALVSLPVALAVDVLAWLAVVAINPAYRAPMGRGYYGAPWTLLFLTFVTLAVSAALYVLGRLLLRPARSNASVAAGALAVPLLLGVLTTLALPAFSYVFAWPTLAGIGLLGWTVLGSSAAARPWPRLVGLSVVALVVVAVAVVPAYLIYSAFAAPGSARQSPIFPVLALLIVASLSAALVPHLHFLAPRRRWTIPAALVALAAVCLGGQLIATRFDVDTPRPDYIQYSLDADTGQATWLSAGSAPDDWTRQFFANGFATGRATFSPGYYFEQQHDVITAAAPQVELPAPTLTVLESRPQGDQQTVRLKLASPRGAPYAHLDLALPGELTAAAVNGKPVNVADIPTHRRQRFTLLYFGLPRGGVAVDLTLRGSGALTGTLADYSNGLPSVPGMTVSPRPAGFIPAPFDFRDPTTVHRRVEVQTS
jgi:Peptidase family M28